MKSKLSPLVAVVFAVTLIAACSGLNRNLYNAENVAVDSVRGAVHTYNGWFTVKTNTPDTNAIAKLVEQRDKVYAEVKNFGVLTKTVDQFRLQYATNSASTNLTALQAGVNALTSQSGNIVTEITAIMAGSPPQWPTAP